jgi:hypothetical protein
MAEWVQRRQKRVLVWYTDGPRPIKALVCIDGAQEGGHSFSLGLHTTVFQPEIYAIKACIMENIEKGYTGRNIYILSDSHQDP